MRLHFLVGLITAATLALPTAASAYVITIVGYDPLTTTAPPAGAPGPNPNNPFPSVFVGLGDCVGPGFPNSCVGSPTPPIGTNPMANPADVVTQNILHGTNYTNAAIAGYGFNLDQVIFHSFMQPTTGGTYQQGFEFVVGSTGGGSAGLCPPCTSFDYIIDLARNVTVSNDAQTNSVTQLIHQMARLTVSFSDEDTLLIYATDDPTFGTGGPTAFNLGADGTVFVTLGGAGPVIQGDPDTDVIITSIPAAPLPLPSTLAMFSLGLGLAGFVRAKRFALS